jgi:hypothetical protein
MIKKNVKMKTSKLYTYAAVALWMCLGLVSCDEEKLGPVLHDSTAFVAPSFMNSATATASVLSAEKAAEVYEKFEWERANYGVPLSTDYVIEMDNDEDFSSPHLLAETSSNSATVTVEEFNNAMLALGLPGFQESTVYLRVRSTINGYDQASPLYSQVIQRTATTYQSSDCGNFCTIGLIGDATAGGWNVDTDLRLADPTGADKHTWTTTVFLTGGKSVKFRASDDWTDNWGGTDFASGTGTKNGPDISVPASGYYKVTFNDNTGAYTFTALSAPTFSTIGIIGDATSGGWNTDTDLTADPQDPHVWTGTITLTAGSVKFRADNDWANNWGNDTAPSGIGIPNGPNIPVAVGGTYFVRFNDATGEYSFMAPANATPYASVGIIGTAQSGGWDSDTDMIKNPTNPYLWSKVIVINDGEAKFRANNDWAVNWGSTTFPAGIGIQNGSNIPTKEGKYFVTFNSGTGEYYFLK